MLRKQLPVIKQQPCCCFEWKTGDVDRDDDDDDVKADRKRMAVL